MRACTLLLVACGCTQALSETYRDPHGRYAIGHPASFRPSEQDRQAVFRRDNDPGLTVTVATAPRREDGRREDRTLASSARAAKTMLRSFSGAKLGAERETRVGEHAALSVDVTFTHQGRAYQRRQFVVEGAKDIAYVALTAPKERFFAGEAVVAAMLDSIELLGEGGAL